MSAAFLGRWELRGGVRVPIPLPASGPGRPPRPTVGEWDTRRLLDAHRRFNGGDRSLLVCEGERVYQARRKRAQRSGVMSPVDRVWAERNAVKSSWEMDTRANRRASVTNTTT